MKEKDLKQIEEVKILNKMHQGVQIGIVGINHVLERLENVELIKHLESQQMEFEKIDDKIIHICKKYGFDDDSISKWKIISSEIITEVKIAFGDVEEKVIDMMVKGYHTGITTMNQLKNEYKGTDEELKSLLFEFIALQEHNLDELKIYL